MDSIPAALALPAPTPAPAAPGQDAAPADPAGAGAGDAPAGFGAILGRQVASLVKPVPASPRDMPAVAATDQLPAEPAEPADPGAAALAIVALLPPQTAPASVLPAQGGSATAASDIATSPLRPGSAPKPRAAAVESKSADLPSAAGGAPADEPGTATATLVAASANADAERNPDGNEPRRAAPSVAAAESVTLALADSASTPRAAQAAPVTQVTVRAPVGSPEFTADFARQASVVVLGGERAAEIRVTPPELGPVEVRVRVQDDQAIAQFSAASPAAREAIEASLPRLREMLADAGIRLDQASVQAEPFGHAGKDGQGERGSTGGRGAGDHAEGGSAAVPPSVRRALGLVDLFA